MPNLTLTVTAIRLNGGAIMLHPVGRIDETDEGMHVKLTSVKSA